MTAFRRSPVVVASVVLHVLALLGAGEVGAASQPATSSPPLVAATCTYDGASNIAYAAAESIARLGATAASGASHERRAESAGISPGYAPQTTPDPNCTDSVVIGESTDRTREAAAAFGARIWVGPRLGASHLEKCAANEAWIRAEIQRGTHIIDIGIDSSRQQTRSPYYALELRELAAVNYPVEHRPWGPSPNQYVDEDYGGPCP